MILPYGISFDDWASSLNIDFPNDNIPLLYNSDWKSFGEVLVSCESFISNSAPSPSSYNDVQEWMMDVYLAMDDNS